MASSRLSISPNKQSQQDNFRILKDAMATCTRYGCIDDFPAAHEAENVRTQRSSSPSRHMQDKLSNNIRKQHLLGGCLGDSTSSILCVEVAERGTHWKYLQASPKLADGKRARNSFQVVNMKPNQNPFADVVAFVRSCIVPEGYPESVSASYMPYMHWRALKYFFGGAMSVFTTRSLLHALGVSQGAASTAVAANWVIKDGAGRIGKMLFARHGKKFDCDMKQLRFMGDLLMEFGAAIELTTITAPNLFLPLACAANVAKNVAAVTSTSTRAPIYKAFARGENIGDVTAKGECISNVADLLGTGLGIFISKRNPSLMVTFAVLSCGYLCCSYNEIKSVVLPTLNRARFGVAVQSFLHTGRVPSLSEGNQKENVLPLPWAKDKPIMLGARVGEAFENPDKFLDLLPVFQKEKYMLSYNVARRQVYVVLKEKANSEDIVRAMFHAQVIASISGRSLSWDSNFHTKNLERLEELKRTWKADMGMEALIRESCNHVTDLYEAFKHQVKCQGWMMGESLLNPGVARLCAWKGA